ncbi:MAG: ACT domain-containing protein [Candidatus Sumerlaeia bacterium]|nr:ACT domain-containing protein [Candidatus Sumerlaeia bacterium]
MRVQQISIFLENRAGRLAAVARLLGDEGINIRALSLADTSDFGILRLIVDRPDAAQQALRREQFTYSTTDVVAVEIPDVPGGLAGVLEVLQDGGVNVEYMYAFVEKANDRAVVVFRFENLEGAASLLESAGVRVLTRAEVLSL